MFRKMLFVSALAILPATVASAQVRVPMQGDWEIRLGGGGSNNQDFNAGSFNIDGSLGYYLSKQLEVSLRQSVSYGDNNNGTAWNGSTRVALDLNFDLGKFQPYVGANIGFVYGDSVSDTWAAAPEAGVRFYVLDRTFIFGQAEYQFFFRDSGGIGDGFDNGQFVYSLGIGFNL